MVNLLVLILNLLDKISSCFVIMFYVTPAVSVISYNCNCTSRMFCLHLLMLQRPTLTYATAAIKFSETQIASLNACWNSVFRRIFHFNRWESVKCFIPSLDRLDIKHLRLQLSTKLYLSVQLCKNSVVREVFKTCTFSKEFIKLYILSKRCIKTRVSTVKCIMYDIFDACINSWYNLV